MKILLSDIDYRLIERVCKTLNEKTGIDMDGYIEVDTILSILDDLEDSYSDLKGTFEEYKEMIKENYKRCDVDNNFRFYVGTIERLQNEVDKQFNFIKERGLEEEYGKYNG